MDTKETTRDTRGDNPLAAGSAGPKSPMEHRESPPQDAPKTVRQRPSAKPAANRKPANPGTEKQRPAGAAAGRTEGRAVRQRPDPETTGDRPRSTARRQSSAPTGRPTGKTAGRPAQTGKRTEDRARKPMDSGYQPYKKANQKKKAQRAGKVKTFFSDQNPLLKWYEKVRYKKDAFAEDSDLARQRKQQRAEEAKKRQKRQSQFQVPAVVYTKPQAFNRDRLIIQLITIAAIVLALVMGLSVFFKVKVISVSGAEVYSPWSIREASGISEGDNLLTFGRARAASQIRASLPYVKSVRIGIKLPDTVNIEIVEDDIVYAIMSDDGIWWLINSEGKVMEMANNSRAESCTQVVGVTLTSPTPGQIGIATENAPAETSTEGEVIPVTVTGAQRLNVALQILTALEDNDIVGEAASVDVSRLEDIILWYGTRYQVNLGDSSNLEYKIACMCDAILQMSDYQTGILDISFTTWTTQVGYTPFE